MKIAISNLAWETSEQEAVATLFQQYDIRGVEIAPTKLWNSPTTESKTVIQQEAIYWLNKNITPVAVQSVLFGHPELTIFQDPASRTKTLAYLKEIVRVSALLGAKVIVFGSPKNRLTYGLATQTIRKIAIPFFTELGETARQYQVNFCIEPNAKAYGCDFVTNTQEGIELVKMINHPNIGLNLDTGIMTLNKETYLTAITQALPYLRHLHISEPFLAPISTEKTDHHMVASTLRSVKYTQWVSVEMKNQSTHNLATLEQTIKLVKAVYQQN